MKKLLKILIILTLISSLLSAISFFTLDYAHIKDLYRHSSMLQGYKYNHFKDYMEDEIEDTPDYEDYDLIDKGANFFAYKLTEHILGSVSDLVTDSITDEIALDDYFSDNEISKEYKYLLKSEKLNKFNSLHITAQFLCVKVEKSDEYKIDFYSKKKNNDNIKNIDIKQDGSKYEITSQKNFERNIPYLVISTPDIQNLKIKFDTDNAVFVAKDSLKSADLKMKNGVISLSGENSYDIDINASDCIMKINFKNYDAQLNIEENNGVADIFGKKHIGEDKKIEQKIKNARDKINLKIDSGFIKIK